MTPLSPDEIGLTVRLGDNDGTTPFYIYAPGDIDFSVSSKKGNVESVQIFYQGKELRSFTGHSGTFHLTPDMSEEGNTNLEMRITVTVDHQKYHETIEHKIQYVKLSEEDFELKEATINRFVFKMTGKKIENHSYILHYMLNKEVIEDLNNIIIERKFAQFSFPTESSIHIALARKGYENSNTQFYPSVELHIQDKKLGDFRYGFEIFDLESRESVFSSKGQFQSIDPVTGNLLYYDENYGVKNNMYDNHVLDVNYNKISVFEDASQSSYGAFLQFNNYVIKGARYTNLLPQNNR